MKYILITILFSICLISSNCQVDTLYNENGEIKAIGELKNGEKKGVWLENFADGTYLHKTIYLNKGKFKHVEYLFGDFQHAIYLDSRKIKFQIVENNVKYPVKQLIGYLKKDSTKGVYGKELYYFPDGSIAQKRRFKNGYLHGKHKVYYQNGTIANIIVYKMKENHGKFRTYYENGQLMIKGRYKHDARLGTWKEYYDNGQIKCVGKYCTDIDPIKITRENQHLTLERFPYLENEIIYFGRVIDFKSGTWQYFNKSGQLIREESYHAGILIETKEY